MGLSAQRQIFHLDLALGVQYSCDRGGILSSVPTSGDLVKSLYVPSPSGSIPVGVLLVDVEDLNLQRQYHPGLWRGQREVFQPFEQILFSRRCNVITDFISPNANLSYITVGQPVYVGTYGLFTDQTDSNKGQKVGVVQSALRSDPHSIIVQGRGFSYSKQARIGGQIGPPIVQSFGPAKTIKMSVPGWLGVKINIR